MDNKGKEGSMGLIFVVMLVSLGVASMWDKVPVIKNFAHSILNPTAGALLNWNVTFGMLILVFLISVFTMLVQKYATDQETLKELKKEQKILNEQMKEFKNHPEKLMELQKKQLEFIPKTFKLTSRAMVFTAVPFILLFRWFNDYFSALEDLRFFGFMTWFWFYFVFVMIFSSIMRKAFKVA